MAGEEGPSSSGGGDDTNGKYPVGFRFKPSDQEVVEFYLLPKLQDKPTVPNDVIIEDDVYSCDPEILTQKYKDKGEDTWFFLSPRTRKYQKGDRPSRRTADDRGRWKPSTGKAEKCSVTDDEEGFLDLGEEEEDGEKLCGNGAIKFCVNTLAYHQGPASKETKTKWLMREYTLPEYEIEVNSSKPSGANMMLDRYAMCNIYISPMKKWRTVKKEETSTASEAAAAVPPMLETDEGTAPPKEQAAGKRPAAEQQQLGRAPAANKRARQPTPSKVQPAPVHNNGGGAVMGAPLGGGAAGYYVVPGQQAPMMPWPPVTGNRLQGPVQRTYQHNGQPVAALYGVQAPVQGLAGPRLRPPVSAHNSYVKAMLMHPPPSPGFQQKVVRPQIGPNMAAGQKKLPPPPATVMHRPTSSGSQQKMMHPQNGPNMTTDQTLPPPPAPVMRPPPSSGLQQKMVHLRTQKVVNMVAGSTLRPPPGPVMRRPPPTGGSQQQLVRPQSGPNMAAGQMLPPPPAPQPPHRLQKMDMNDPESQRVMALVLAELQKPESRQLLESCGVQQESLMALNLPSPPTLDASSNHTATASFTVPHAQHSAPHSGGQQQQQQQRSSPIPATSAPSGAAAQAEATTASGKLSPVRRGADGGNGKGGARQQS